MIQNIIVTVLALSVAVYAVFAASPTDARRDSAREKMIRDGGASRLENPYAAQAAPSCSQSPTPGG
jgi:hypothetical protein